MNLRTRLGGNLEGENHAYWLECPPGAEETLRNLRLAYAPPAAASRPRPPSMGAWSGAVGRDGPLPCAKTASGKIQISKTGMTHIQGIRIFMVICSVMNVLRVE